MRPLDTLKSHLKAAGSRIAPQEYVKILPLVLTDVQSMSNSVRWRFGRLAQKSDFKFAAPSKILLSLTKSVAMVFYCDAQDLKGMHPDRHTLHPLLAL